MADKIDYKAYLAQLGKVETSQVERIKKYLEEQILEDEALKALYRPEKINDCYDFIMHAVKEMPRNGSCVCIDDGVVFKMARDYFIEILPKVADEPPEVKVTGAETAADAETEAETEPMTATEESSAEADNENSGTPCEDAEPENEKPVEEVMLHQADETGGEESAESENSEAETEQAAQEKPADNENEVVRDKYGFEVFGEEPESVSEAGAETAAEATMDNIGPKAEPENEKPESSEIRYDEEGNGLLFGF